MNQTVFLTFVLKDRKIASSQRLTTRLTVYHCTLNQWNVAVDRQFYSKEEWSKIFLFCFWVNRFESVFDKNNFKSYFHGSFLQTPST